MTVRHPYLRRSILFGGPFLVYVAGLVHPTSLVVGEPAGRFVAVHLVLPALVCLLAGALWLLVDGVDGIAAGVARVLVLPFAVAYTVFTTYGGIAVGMFVYEAGKLPAAEQPAADVLIGRVSHGTLEEVLWLTAVGIWLATVAAIVVALRRRAPWPALALMAVGAVVFARSHVSPWGPAGMAAFTAGVVWLELRPRGTGERVPSHTPLGYDRDDGHGRPDPS